MNRKPLTPDATEALNDVMRKFCEDVERRKADQETERAGRLADELGANV